MLPPQQPESVVLCSLASFLHFTLAHAPPLAYTRSGFKLGLYRHGSTVKLDTGEGQPTFTATILKISWLPLFMIVNFSATYLSLADHAGCHLSHVSAGVDGGYPDNVDGYE